MLKKACYIVSCAVLLGFGGLVGCREDKVAPIIVQFVDESLSIAGDSSSQVIKIEFSSPSPVTGDLIINVANGTGTTQDSYSTDPSIENSTIQIHVTSGQTFAQFSLAYKPHYTGSTFTVSFTLAQTSSILLPGARNKLTVTMTDPLPSKVDFAGPSVSEIGGVGNVANVQEGSAIPLTIQFSITPELTAPGYIKLILSGAVERIHCDGVVQHGDSITVLVQPHETTHSFTISAPFDGISSDPVDIDMRLISSSPNITFAADPFWQHVQLHVYDVNLHDYIVGLLIDGSFIPQNQFRQSASVPPEVALDSLVKYVTNYPDILTLLSGVNSYTLFAPSNAAFASLLATPGYPQSIGAINPDVIKGIILFGLTPGQQLESSLTSGSQLESMYVDPFSNQSQTISINSDGTLKTGASTHGVHVVSADLMANNGVLHIVDNVLMAPSMGDRITPALGTIAGTLQLQLGFQNIALMMGKADYGYVEGANLGQKKIATILSSPPSSLTSGSPLTFFASDVTALSNLSPSDSRAILLSYIALGKYMVHPTSDATPIIGGLSISVLSGATVWIKSVTPLPNIPSGFEASFQNAGDGPGIYSEITASNGVTQVLSSALNP